MPRMPWSHRIGSGTPKIADDLNVATAYKAAQAQAPARQTALPQTAAAQIAAQVARLLSAKKG